MPCVSVEVQWADIPVLRPDAVPLENAVVPLRNVKAQGKPVYTMTCAAKGPLGENVVFTGGVERVKGGTKEVVANGTPVAINNVPGSVETSMLLVDVSVRMCTKRDPRGVGVLEARQHHQELVVRIHDEASEVAGKLKQARGRAEYRQHWEHLLRLADTQIASERYIDQIDPIKGPSMVSSDSVTNVRYEENRRQLELIDAWRNGIFSGMGAQTAYWNNKSSAGVRIAGQAAAALEGALGGLKKPSTPEPLSRWRSIHGADLPVKVRFPDGSSQDTTFYLPRVPEVVEIVPPNK